MPQAGAGSGSLRLIAWAGGVVFVVSLAFGAYCYGWTFETTFSRGPDEARSVTIDVGLFTLFALHHSLFARVGLKGWVRRTFPAPLERSLYVWVASLLFIAVCGLWQPVGGLLWRVDGPARVAMMAGQLAAVVFVLLAASRLDVLDLAGLRQVLDSPASAAPHTLDHRGPYGLVRHPIYLGWVLMVWLAPTMNGTRLVFALTSTVYLLLAIPFEERDLRRTFGRAYDDYSERVRWRIVPYVF